jgi:hypothetical protein
MATRSADNDTSGNEEAGAARPAGAASGVSERA